MEEAMPFGLDFCFKRLEGRGGLCPVDGLKKNGPASELAKPFFICPWLPWQPPPIKSLLFLNCGNCPQFKNLFGLYQWFNPIDPTPPLAA